MTRPWYATRGSRSRIAAYRTGRPRRRCRRGPGRAGAATSRARRRRAGPAARPGRGGPGAAKRGRSGRLRQRLSSTAFIGSGTKRRNWRWPGGGSPTAPSPSSVRLPAGATIVASRIDGPESRSHALDVALRRHRQEQLALREPEDRLVPAEELEVGGVGHGASSSPSAASSSKIGPDLALVQVEHRDDVDHHRRGRPDGRPTTPPIANASDSPEMTMAPIQPQRRPREQADPDDDAGSHQADADGPRDHERNGARTRAQGSGTATCEPVDVREEAAAPASGRRSGPPARTGARRRPGRRAIGVRSALEPAGRSSAADCNTRRRRLTAAGP